MRNGELEKRVRTAVEHAAPDVLSRVLSSCGEQKGNVIAMETRKKKNMIPAIAAMAAVLVLVCAAALGRFAGPRSVAPASAVITLDVNPSVSLTVDGDERVVEAAALNDDGSVVLEGMDLTGAELNVAVNAIIGSMLQHGYLDLDNFENAILVSVESGDQSLADQLRQQVSEAVSSAFRRDKLSDGLILAQTVSADDNLTALAAEYGISQGKAALIQDIIAQDGTLSFQSLAPLTINEIALIAGSRGLSISSVTQTGAASEAAYIGGQSALDRACAHVNVPVADALDAYVEFDCEDGVMVYEVDFCHDGLEYECDIDARTGAVLFAHHETCDHAHHSGHHGGAAASTAPAAPSAAPATAPGSESSDSPTPPAQTSAPASAPVSTPAPVQSPAPAAYIGEESAQSYALAHAGCAASNTLNLSCWLEYDDGVPECYEVEFCHNGVQYEYEIGLYDGAVLHHQQETCTNGLHDHHSGQSGQGHHGGGHHGGGYGQGAGQTRVGLAAARDAALTHAGVLFADAFDLEAELDDDGLVYDVEFKSGGYEYKYEIDAYSGAVAEYRMELDD